MKNNTLVEINGFGYKFGLNLMVFVSDMGDWVHSSKTEKQLLSAWENEFNKLGKFLKKSHLNRFNLFMNDLIESGEWKKTPVNNILEKFNKIINEEQKNGN